MGPEEGRRKGWCCSTLESPLTSRWSWEGPVMISVSPCDDAPSLRIERKERTEPKFGAFELPLGFGATLTVAELELLCRECEV